jgi:RND family efflux transporter MFP subunit
MKLDETEDPEVNTAPTEVKAAAPKALGVVGRILAVVLMVAAAVALGLAIRSGISVRAAALQDLVHSTDDSAVQTVAVTHPQRASTIQELVLPGNTQAFTDSPIYARTNGYLKRWYFDIGTRVRKGDLLAEIETPEIDQQLQQARAGLESAKANFHLASTTAERWQFLLKSNSVSKQETDQAVANMEAQKATVEANDAAVRRLEQLQDFEKVYAPFDGVITARSTDIGALIDAGTVAQGKELFHLAAVGTMRVFVAVPEEYSSAAQSGTNATLTLTEFPGRVFTGTIVRDSNSIDAASRTLLVEVDVDNPAGEIRPGAYVTVHVKLAGQVPTVTIPANTLLFREEGLRVGLVRDGKAVITPVTIGRDYGSTVEILSGLRSGDSVILDPSDSLTTGTKVRVAQAAAGGNR